MRTEDLKALWLDTARFYLERVKQCDAQRVEDVLAIMQHREYVKKMKWCAKSGRDQVFVSSTMLVNEILAWFDSNERWSLKEVKQHLQNKDVGMSCKYLS